MGHGIPQAIGGQGARAYPEGMLLALLLICVALFVVLPLIGAALNVLWALVLGFLLGLVARAIAPGRGRLGLLFTTVAGVAGAMIGAVVARLLDTGGTGRLLLQLLAAVVVVIGLRREPRPVAGRKAA